MWDLLPKDRNRVVSYLVTNEVVLLVTKHRVVYSSLEQLTNREMIGLTFIFLRRGELIIYLY